MKYKKLLKKAAVSLLLAQSLIFTGLPIQAADIAGQGMVWTERAEMENAGDTVSAVSSDKMAAEESYVQDDFSAGDDLSGSGSTLDDAVRLAMEVQKMMTARLAMEVQKAMPARLAMEVRKTMPVSQAMPAS